MPKKYLGIKAPPISPNQSNKNTNYADPSLHNGSIVELVPTAERCHCRIQRPHRCGL
ncbi:hypothetical protein [Rubritalea tangerina]|uniref:hypothetical protein n=1 Tax=Rubritalea tangerina TaxID=430798 RepID=UPI0036072120